MGRKILQAKGASILAGEALAYGRKCRFFQPLSQEEVESLNHLLALTQFTDSDLEQVRKGEDLAISIEWQGKTRIIFIDPVIVSRAKRDREAGAGYRPCPCKILGHKGGKTG
jgi:hypothetical protein